MEEVVEAVDLTKTGHTMVGKDVSKDGAVVFGKIISELLFCCGTVHFGRTFVDAVCNYIYFLTFYCVWHSTGVFRNNCENIVFSDSVSLLLFSFIDAINKHILVATK